MLYSQHKPPLSEWERFESRHLYRCAHSGYLEQMIKILNKDKVGIADYHCGNFENPIATTLTVYLTACRREKEKALIGTKLLVEHGADVSTELLHGRYGDTALSHAVFFDLVDVARYLIGNKGEILPFYSFRSVEMTKLFIENGYDITSRGSGGVTLLHCASGTGTNFSKLRNFLVVEGWCDIDELDDQGDSALHIAARNGSTEYLIQLCYLGATLDIRNNKGKTPLDEAVFIWTRLDLNVDQHRVLGIRERKKILEAEPQRRETIEYLCFRFSDCEFRGEFSVFKEEESISNLLHLDPEIHRLVMEKIGLVPLKR